MMETAPILAPRFEIFSPDGKPLPPAPARDHHTHELPRRPQQKKPKGAPLAVRVMAVQIVNISNAAPPRRRAGRWLFLTLAWLLACAFLAWRNL